MNGFPQFDLNGQVPLVTGAARGLGRAILLALVLACAVEFDFAVESALAQGPQPGAPASDVSNIPKPVTDTFDRVRMRNGPNDTQAGHKSAEKEDTCLLPPLTLVHSPLVATAALQVPAKAKKEYGEACAALKEKKIERVETQSKNIPGIPLPGSRWARYSRHNSTATKLVVRVPRGQRSSPPMCRRDLCLADIAAREKAWNEVVKLSSRAVGLDPATNAVAYEYNAAANLGIISWRTPKKAR